MGLFFQNRDGNGHFVVQCNHDSHLSATGESLEEAVVSLEDLLRRRIETANVFGISVKGQINVHIAVPDGLSVDFDVELSTEAQDRVSYTFKETLECNGHIKMQAGGENFAYVTFQIEPLIRNPYPFRLTWQVSPDKLKLLWLPAIVKGLQRALHRYWEENLQSLSQLHFVLVEGREHETDSKNISFVIATYRAFVDAMSRTTLVPIERSDIE